jgi:hypothetical protein
MAKRPGAGTGAGNPFILQVFARVSPGATRTWVLRPVLLLSWTYVFQRLFPVVTVYFLLVTQLGGAPRFTGAFGAGAGATCTRLLTAGRVNDDILLV